NYRRPNKIFHYHPSPKFSGKISQAGLVPAFRGYEKGKPKMVGKSRFDLQHDMPDGPRAGNQLRVLIVDDDPDTADTMVILLSHWGFQATAVRCGVEALQAAQVTSPPDVILLDIGMPGMDGLEVARRLRKEVPGD